MLWPGHAFAHAWRSDDGICNLWLGEGKTGRLLSQTASMLLFVAAGAGHEVADGVAGAFIVVQDGVHLLGDGHFYAIAGG
jgi:hypothetical protein